MILNREKQKEFIEATTLIIQGLGKLDDLYLENEGLQEIHDFEMKVTDMTKELEKKIIPRMELTQQNALLFIQYLQEGEKFMTEIDEVKMNNQLICILKEYLETGKISEKNKEWAEDSVSWEFQTRIITPVVQLLVHNNIVKI
ncbi:hypothetical protein CO726_24900 [Bacillus fungorum]|uniref:Uncharacterized protein n=1 Tax=Bacillus fungorum TaxID=2039284 RepID=A0A2G6Q7K9_9BACI|nr:hypothetical protein [Bacillus fungorum]PIE92808.1 hypothetical protein CO726_24900 [Bacillus fungorum]